MLPVVNLGTVITTDWYPSTLACKAGQSTSPVSRYCYQVSHIMGSGFRPMLWDWPFPLSLGTSAIDSDPSLISAPALVLASPDFLAKGGSRPVPWCVLALEMVQMLATGTTVPQDRIKPSQRWLSYPHFAPSTLLRRDALHYEKSFESVDLQLHLPRTYSFLPIAPSITSYLLSPRISSPIPSIQVIYTILEQQIRLYNQLLKTNMIQQQLDYYFCIFFWSFLIFFLFLISCIVFVYNLFYIVLSFLNLFCIFAYSLFCFAFLHLFYLFLFDSLII